MPLSHSNSLFDSGGNETGSLGPSYFSTAMDRGFYGLPEDATRDSPGIGTGRLSSSR